LKLGLERDIKSAKLRGKMSDNQNLNNQPQVTIEHEMKTSYLDYAMSVIVSRAIPDVCDGLKPVHRRILYAMYESGSHYNKPYRKSARIVGEVMGKYHPHGDTAIYDSLVRMAQDFSLRLPLVDGQGNFGSMDGDSAAAMRYTESRLEQVTHTMLEDIDKDTVDFSENYDGSESEPDILPARFPNLLVNGAGGIAVGMATNIPPFNLGEVIDGVLAYLDNEEITAEEFLDIIPAPDFPTGGIILGRTGSKSACLTGRGSVKIRARTNVETNSKGREKIIVTEIPYQVNKSKMIEKIAELVKEKRVEGISDLRDESNKKGVRVVIEIKRDANAQIVLNQLFRYSQLQVSFGVNMLALNAGKPELLNVHAVIKAFTRFREKTIIRRTMFLLNKARSRGHILIGLLLAVDSIDEVIALIRASKDTQEAKEKLLSKTWLAKEVLPLIELVGDKKNAVTDDRCFFTVEQVQAILDMKLARLTGLERDKIEAELSELKQKIEEFLELLGNRPMLLDMMRQELIEIKEKYANPRRTSIEDVEYEHDIEDLIDEEDMVITVTVGGYIKRVPLETYKAQRRGGKGRAGLKKSAEDPLTDMFVTTTHTPVLFFSNIGKVYKLKTYTLPLTSPQAVGRALVNILPLADGEKINNIMPLPKDDSLWADLNLMFATAKGNIRRSDMADFKNIQSNGKIAIRLDESDRLIAVRFCEDEEHVFLASKKGKALRFEVSKVRVIKSRTSSGVRGMRLAKDDELISMTILKDAKFDREIKDNYLSIALDRRLEIANYEGESFDVDFIDELKIMNKESLQTLSAAEEFILGLTANGFGKRTSSYEYRVTSRGGSGIINIITSERNGDVVASFPVTQSEQILLMTDKGKLIRTKITDIRVAGRSTQGVTILKTEKGEQVVSAAKIAIDESDDHDLDDDEADDMDVEMAQPETVNEAENVAAITPEESDTSH
jgi:DNA gyrase subunit A